MKNNEDYKYSDLTGKIISCAMKVHSTLGNGFQEVIYQRCLAIEMQLSYGYMFFEDCFSNNFYYACLYQAI